MVEPPTSGGSESASDYANYKWFHNYLPTILARTLIVQGDRDPLYPVEMSVDMAKAIPGASLWVITNAGHGPVIGAKWIEFVKTATEFLLQ